jgi:hypothetical protein
MNPFYGAALACLLLIGAFGAGWHFGGQAPKLAAAKQELKQEAAEDTKRTTDQTTVAQEAKTYEAATDPLAPLPAPVVRLCYNSTTPAVPSAHPAGPGAHGPVPVPDAGGGDSHLPTYVQWNTRPLVQIGRNADAQVAGLQDYITRVCQAHAP